MRWRLPVVLVTATAALAGAAPASADLASLKLNCTTKNAGTAGTPLLYKFCNDGVPDFGGRTPNPGALKAVAVPEKYKGYVGLPAADTPDPNTGADPVTGTIALDVDVTMPDAAKFPPPAGGYPLMVMMHGCCAGDKTGWEATSVDAGGEKWHYSNAWFASRGYVVLNYTARGFVDGSGHGSTGETQLDSRNYEINDYQYLAGLLADDPFFHVDPKRIVTTGGSYGGGFSWLALTDPTWKSPGGKDMQLVASAPKYGWTDLVYSLVPNGMQLHSPLPPTSIAAASNPFGFPKASINTALFLSGQTGIPSGGKAPPHTTFPSKILQSFICLQSGDPYEENPACQATVASLLPEFYSDRSAYYQNDWFTRIATDPTARVPLFSAGTWTDPLFTPIEHLRMVQRILSIDPSYPVQQYYGDYQHFVQNKAKEWGDLCGADRHVCTLADYPGGDLNATPAGFVATGVTSRLDRFVDHYASPPGDASQPTPAFDVTASLQICPQNADASHPKDGPGDRFTVPAFGDLAPNVLTVQANGQQATTNQAPSDHAANADPVANLAANGGACPVETTAAGPGIAVYDSSALSTSYTMLGLTRVSVPHTGTGGDIQLNARLYDVYPNGMQVMVDRGVRRVINPNETSVFELHGNGWRFAKGHRIRIELTQDDNPYIRSSNQPSSLLLSGVKLQIPVREGPGPGVPTQIGGVPTGASPLSVQLIAPRLASDRSRTRRFPVKLVGSLAVDHYQIDRFHGGGAPRWTRVASNVRGSTYHFNGQYGGIYTLRARAIGKNGKAGPWSKRATTIVPLDDRVFGFFGSWVRLKRRWAWVGSVNRATGAGDTATYSFRSGSGKLYLIGRTAPEDGNATATLDGRKTKVSFHASKVHHRAVVAVLTVKKARRHSLRLRTLGPIDLDGIALSVAPSPAIR